jgi:hypothetical protein
VTGRPQLRLLSGPQQHLAHKRLRGLRYQHGYDTSYVFRLDLLLRIAVAASKPGVDRSWCDDLNPNIVLSQLFGNRVDESI